MSEPTTSLTDADLLSRLTNFEDNFVERKTSGDHKDWLKTAIAFANSTPIGFPAVLFVGVRDDGNPECGLNLDRLQQTFGSKMQAAYPPVYFATKILGANDRQFLAVIVPGSADRPHFAGPSYVRKGSVTEVASEAQFAELLASRQSKSGEILKWKGKVISADRMRVENVHLMGPVESTAEFEVFDCNPFYVSLKCRGSGTEAIPLKRIEISFDGPKNRLKLEVYPV
jgi:predicted HTH transcriptional regulator